ncbi:IS66 family insertion sequence element accessory protein TnpA [Sorangium sp. So ce233]|uniref:IS66 family insertion sequence element accessory protein TnpA n=1 Tax=Sorangium sp. So ce233 TaxID=3133290 RepID=UPI003F61CB42
MLSSSRRAAWKPAPEVSVDESIRIWRARVARRHKSGHSARVFAEQEGVNAGTLYSWNRRLGMKRSEYRQRSEKATLPALLPVVVGPGRSYGALAGRGAGDRLSGRRGSEAARLRVRT